MNLAKLSKAFMLGLILVTVPALSEVANAAQKREQTFVKKDFKTLYRSVQQVGDVPNHELVQEMTVADMKISNPDFKVKEEWVYIHSDLIDGNGPHSGYFYDTHEDGSLTYGSFKGMVKTVSKPDGSWESS